MKKMSTLFMKDPNNLGRVINELNPENKWVLGISSVPTRKFDGTSCAIIDGELYKRYDAKKGKPIPEGAIPCQPPDEITGHHPHWIKCIRGNPGDKYHFEGFDNLETIRDDTYELCGPKIQGNPEHFDTHTLVRHGSVIVGLNDLSFEGIKEFLSDPKNDIEGIVFHKEGSDEKCKIRKSDFGITR